MSVALDPFCCETAFGTLLLARSRRSMNATDDFMNSIGQTQLNLLLVPAVVPLSMIVFDPLRQWASWITVQEGELAACRRAGVGCIRFWCTRRRTFVMSHVLHSDHLLTAQTCITAPSSGSGNFPGDSWWPSDLPLPSRTPIHPRSPEPGSNQ